MKQVLLMIAVVALVGCGESISDPIVEKAIRMELKKPTGELTQTDLEEVKFLWLQGPIGPLELAEVSKELEKLTQLENLNLDANKLTDVRGLEKLTKLTKLSLNNNKLTDVSGLEKLTQLRDLRLMGNQLTEVPKGLEKLTQLEMLFLNNNPLTSVKGLEKLTKLEVLWLNNNPDLTKAQIAELRKALPKCRIHW